MSNSASIPAADDNELTQAASEAGGVKISAEEMAFHVLSAADPLASQSVDHVGRTADDLVSSDGFGMQELADNTNRNVPPEGLFGNSTTSLARTVRESGEYFQGTKAGGVIEDIAQVIRRNPITAILIAIGLGWFVQRKLRS